MKKEKILAELNHLLEIASAEKKVVVEDAIDLVDQIENDPDLTVYNLQKILLSGAKNWHEYSWGGCALCGSCALAERYCPELLIDDRWAEDDNGDKLLNMQAKSLQDSNWLIFNILQVLDTIARD